MLRKLEKFIKNSYESSNSKDEWIGGMVLILFLALFVLTLASIVIGAWGLIPILLFLGILAWVFSCLSD